MTEHEALEALKAAAVEYCDTIDKALGYEIPRGERVTAVDNAGMALREAGYNFARAKRDAA